MSMFDYYRPGPELRCPVCLRPLREWQGKDGPNALFVWVEGTAWPVDQMVEDVRLTPEQRRGFALPSQFIIYSYDCPEHQPVEARGSVVDGVWSGTVLVPFQQTRH